MMINSFNEKTIYFVSDSNFTAPYYLEYLRVACIQTGKNVYMRNKSIPGARMDMVQNSIEEELLVETPDYVALCFGGNDIGIWMYDATLVETERLLAERAMRVREHLVAFEKNVAYLRARGIEPILITPVCYNENIVEKTLIHTDKDSKEKSAICNSLFTKATFRKINDAICDLSKACISVAERLGVMVWDLCPATRACVDNECFKEDGVHYNEKGHRIIARELYRHMFGEELQEYAITDEIRALAQAEADERAYFFVKYNAIWFNYGKKDGAELIRAVQTFIQEKGYKEGLTEARAEGFFRFAGNPDENQRRIVQLIKGMKRN